MRETGGMGWGDGTRDAGLGFACFFLRFEKGFWCSGDRADFLFAVTNKSAKVITQQHQQSTAFTTTPTQQFSEQRLDSTVSSHGAVNPVTYRYTILLQGRVVRLSGIPVLVAILQYCTRVLVLEYQWYYIYRVRIEYT